MQYEIRYACLSLGRKSLSRVLYIYYFYVKNVTMYIMKITAVNSLVTASYTHINAVKCFLIGCKLFNDSSHL